ncbi:MAG: DUF4861 domain-containing protein [Bacteroidales bacterium]|nr:DUF4861 domain-containing protein [Bacteroidales bacterium]
MRKSTILYLLLGVLTISCSSTPEITLRVTNPMDQKRSDAIILLSRGEISGWTTIPENQLPVLKNPHGDFIPCQADDLDGDGNWDELLGLTDLEAAGHQNILLGFVSPEEYPVFPARTNLHLGDAKENYQKLKRADRLEGVSYHNYSGRTGAAFQMEGPAWENDNVGFRNYLDQRNGFDIFGKTTPEMVLDNVGKEGEPSYHEPGEWGLDVLKVGTSLGAGGIGYMFNDSIYRVGDSGSGTYQVLFHGTQRSRFNLNYTNWMVEDQALNVTHQIEIVAGRHYYQGMVTYSGSEEPMSLVPGIVNMKSDSLHVIKLNDHYTALFTFDQQSEDGSLLAMALVVPSAYLKSTGETRNEGEGIIQTYYAVLDASPGEPVPYRFYSLWEKENQKWSSMEEIENYLKTEAERWTQSVVFTSQL